MFIILNILILVNYVIIACQDFKDREVSVLNYFSLYILLSTATYINRHSLNFNFIIINSLVLSAVTSLLLTYYLIKYKKKSFFKLKSSIGLGDVLMIPAFIVSFSPFNMIVVIIISLIISLLYNLIINFRQIILKTIPLAGILSLMLSLLLIADLLGLINTKNDFYPFIN